MWLGATQAGLSHYTLPDLAAFTHENLEGGEWFVPGNVLGGNAVTDDFWKGVKARRLTKACLSFCAPLSR